MKLKSTLLIMAALALSLQTANAQTNYAEQIAVKEHAIHKKAGITNLKMDIDLSQLKIDKNHLVIVTPVVAALNGNETEELSPVIVLGRTRDKMLKRPFQWKGKPSFDTAPFAQVTRRNGTEQHIAYTAALPYADWQRNARLLIRTEVVGCADCKMGGDEKVIVSKFLPDFVIPDYRFGYTIPQVEEVKTRSETYSAHLNYVVGRWDLLPNFENNAAELAKVDKIVRELQSDNNLKITDFTISGYASPEDTYERNMMLSQRRAETFAQYMEKKYGYTSQQFKVEWFGEDWDGLRKAVENSSLAEKQEILNIIDNTAIHDGREKQLMDLNGGVTYNFMLNNYFPPLRRNEYNIAFVARAFDVNEAKEVIKSKPKLLSLNEMYLVANTYPQNSAEYNNVFRIASETFPNDEVALLNASVGDLRNNKPDEVIKRLQKIKETPQAANLLGVAYSQKGDTARAMEQFNKARQKGNADAEFNAEQLQQYIDDNL